MPFCVNCGKPINEGEACSCTAQPAAAVPPAAPAQPEAPAQQPAPPVTPVAPPQQPAGGEPVPPTAPVAPGAPAQPNPLVQSVVGSVKGVFSASPIGAVNEAANKTDMSWVVIALAGCLASGFGLASTSINAIKQLIKSAVTAMLKGWGYYSKSEVKEYMSELDIEWAGTFWAGVVGFAILFMAVVLLVLCIMALSKKQANFARTANMVAVAMLPAIGLYAVSGILALFFAYGSIVLMGLGTITTLLLVYFGMQRLDRFEKSPFWLYIVAYVVFTIITFVVVNKVMTPMILESIFGESIDMMELLESIMYNLY